MMKCPSCNDGMIVTTVVAEYATVMGGVPFVVKNARLEACNTCNETLWDIKEIIRWERELENQVETFTVYWDSNLRVE